MSTADLRFAHDHYDHTDPDQDPNCIFPLDRLRELAHERVIGSVARWHVGFMGWIPGPQRFARETVPEIVSRLLADHLSVAFPKSCGQPRRSRGRDRDLPLD